MIEKLLSNEGFSLIEALTSLLILSLVGIALLVLVSSMHKNQLKIKALYEEYTFIDCAHDIFNEEPLMFKEYLTKYYGDRWNEYFEYHYNHNLLLVYIEDRKGIEVRVIHKGEWIETWERIYA